MTDGVLTIQYPKTTTRTLYGWEIEEGVLGEYRFMVRSPLHTLLLEVRIMDGEDMARRLHYWNPIFSLPKRMGRHDLEKLFVDYWQNPVVYVPGEQFKETTSMSVTGIAGVHDPEKWCEMQESDEGCDIPLIVNA